MAEEIIFDGSEQKFTTEQLANVEMILASMINTSRWMRRYHSVMRIFLPNISQLIMQGYVIHHIDGNPANDHPSNLMVILKGAHDALHWEQLTPEEYADRCKNISNGLNNRPEDIKQAHYELITKIKGEWSEEDKICDSEARSQIWADYTPEEYNERCKNIADGVNNRPEDIKQMHRDAISRARETCALQARKFIKQCNKGFTVSDFNEIAKFVHMNSASRWLHCKVASGDIEVFGKNGRAFVYHSLICEVNNDW